MSYRINILRTATVFFAFTSCAFAIANHDAPLSPNDINAVKNNLFANIANDQHVFVKDADNKKIHALNGAVLASPSNKGLHFSQDYQFHWTRDAAMTMNEIATLYTESNGAEKAALKPYLINYIQFETKAKQQISRQGEETLGQPKYNIDGTIWEGEWMRPQNDGPALRAIAMMNIANALSQDGMKPYVKAHLIPLITSDLDYVVKTWQEPTFGLWEEVKDKDHFFTKMVQRHALIAGANELKLFQDQKRQMLYLQTAANITASLQHHWNDHLGYFSETINQQYIKGGGLDSSILLGVLYGNLHDPNDPFALNNDRVMSSIYYLRNAFAGLYKINVEHPHHPPLLGRYPNDIYDGDQFVYGNPWVLITNALAEYYYSLANTFIQQGKITVTATNILFFQQLRANVAIHEGVISKAKNPKQFETIITACINEGDQIELTVKQYATCQSQNNCFHFAEQLDRDHGDATSAKDLTWGYATFLSAARSRAEVKL